MSPIGIVLMEKKKCCSFLSASLSPIHGSIFWMGIMNFLPVGVPGEIYIGGCRLHVGI